MDFFELDIGRGYIQGACPAFSTILHKIGYSNTFFDKCFILLNQPRPTILHKTKPPGGNPNLRNHRQSQEG